MYKLREQVDFAENIETEVTVRSISHTGFLLFHILEEGLKAKTSRKNKMNKKLFELLLKGA